MKKDYAKPTTVPMSSRTFIFVYFNQLTISCVAERAELLGAVRRWLRKVVTLKVRWSAKQPPNP